MRVERLNPLFGGRLHHDPPATLKRLLQKRRQHLLRRLPFEMIEKDFGHEAGVLVFALAPASMLA